MREHEISSRWARWRHRILLAGALLIAAAAATRQITQGEFYLNEDETVHAVTGLYFADFLSDMPLTHPIEYTYHYYGQYPALGLVHYPPFFHFLEGLAFVLIGRSPLSARITVLMFTLLGLFYWFELVRELEDEYAAALSTILLGLLPIALLYEKSVMLEIPSLALCVASTYYVLRYLRNKATRYLICLAVFASLAIVTKHNAVYLVLFIFLALLANRELRSVLNWKGLGASLVFLGVVGPVYALMYGVHWHAISADLLSGQTSYLGRYTYYWRTLPGQLGWPLLLLSILGITTARWWVKREGGLIMGSWIATVYVTMTAISLKDPRYVMYWLPPFLYFAVAPLVRLAKVRILRLAVLAVVLMVVAASVGAAWRHQRPYISGYAAAAQRLIQARDSNLVLFDGVLPGNFVFFMRSSDPERRFIVIRKALAAKEIKTSIGFVELLKKTAEIEDYIESYGIKYIAVDEGAPLEFPAQGLLRKLLQSQQFRLIGRFPIDSNMLGWRKRALLLYENRQVKPGQKKMLRVVMLTLDRDICVPLDEFTKPFPSRSAAPCRSQRP
jgi:hypothetical protein